jgi:acetyl-CoA carboxylase biotin carboxylase subunit
LIVWGKDRNEAIERMKRALDEFVINGVKSTIPFHLKLLEHESFVEGNFNMKFLETHTLSIKD